MNEMVKLTPSLEDYLETILLLEEKNKVARVKDIAIHLGVQMPSVSGALKSLKKKGMVTYEKNSFIQLTKSGIPIAKKIYKKHKILVSFFKNVILLDTLEATEVGCKIEHIIDLETALKIANTEKYLEFATKNKSEWSDIISS